MAEDTDGEELVSVVLKKSGGGESQTWYILSWASRLRPPLITFSFTVQAMANAVRLVHSGAARAPLINGCGHTSGMKRGEKSKSRVWLAKTNC